MKVWLASNPTKATLPALPMSCSASSIPCVDDSLTQKMPCSSFAYRFSRFSEARFAVSRVGPAYWSEEMTSMPGALAFSSARKPVSRAVVLADPSW